MRKLVLVRHSLPRMVTGVPANQWHLSPEGRRRCTPLAGRLSAYGLGAVISSQESKAVETGQIVSRTLGLPFETAPNLHEHERGVVTDLGSREDFEVQVAHFFEHPGRLVLGLETGYDACERFSAAVGGVMKRHPAGNVAIVSHGTVMTLFLANATGIDPVPFWKDLGLPAFVALSYPELSLLEVVASVV